ncbi:phosphonate transport system permease protein [Clostridium acidisoli DSM 12555]|jgi:phosphonate transport system permease protein|uniref:Phosphonate transport system permease protein n=1 Tax=Clostridium acidisoli DSM 12555 TaxID=1121291 RepID=A0A1W1XU20_9CLOT|nr:phosphonate ABC transporter, permease protein PhnE [Clostridium acidisoli]SMC27031.1 phosphonate transport system permease protein [Clostridium acidisoli DSM 12555]
MHKAREKISLIDTKRNKYYNIALIIIIIIFVVSTFFTQYNPFEIFFNYSNLTDFITKDFLPPNTTGINEIGLALLQTFEMAVASTFFAAIFALILSFFGSNIIFNVPLVNKIVRLIGSFMRNIPSLIWALILVMAFGIGISVGLLALFIASFGFLLRAYIETIDEVGGEVLEALDSVGASFFQKIIQGVIPMAMPGYLSWFLYSIEVNVRDSTIVGLVGGGGIGLLLMGYIKSFKYNVSATVIFAIAAVVILVNVLTEQVRKKVLL